MLSTFIKCINVFISKTFVFYRYFKYIKVVFHKKKYILNLSTVKPILTESLITWNPI